MPILAVLNLKGGVGKTTLSTNIAACLTAQDKRVLLIDADSQASALDWKNARGEEDGFPVVGIPKPTIHKDIEKISKGYDWVVIDGPPHANAVAKSAIAAADIVLIPVQPSPYDVWASREIVSLIEEIKALKDDLKAAFVVNRKIVGTAIGRDVSKALADYSIDVMKSSVCQRVGFAESAGSGKTLVETDKYGQGAREVKALVKELTGMMDG
jgi:chromosome partitioning protein